MASIALQFVDRLRRAWPASPILDKEMRVTSRRGWLYGLRAAYVVMLAAFTAIIWGSAKGGIAQGLAAFRAPDIGKNIVSSILWFQFVVAQAITILLLSSSFSGEIRQRTLPLLLTAPLDCFQIVREKVAGGIFYVAVLLLCCLPLLSVVRIFGGVPLDSILTSLAVTLTACLFAGAVAAYFSTLIGNWLMASLAAGLAVAAYDAVGWMSFPGASIAVCLFLCAGMFTSREQGDGRGKVPDVVYGLRVVAALLLIPCLTIGAIVGVLGVSFPPLSPAYALHLSTWDMMVPGKVPGLDLLLVLHCGAMVLVSFGVLRIASTGLYRLARTRIWGVVVEGRPFAMIDAAASQKALANVGVPPVSAKAMAEINRLAHEALADSPWPISWIYRKAPAVSYGPPRPVERLGSPLLWKDTLRILPKNRAVAFWCYVVPLSVMLPVLLVSVGTGACRRVGWHAILLSIYMAGGTVLTAIFSATAIGAERQGRTWPLLLTTTLSDRHILCAKSAGVFYRALPAWGPLILHVMISGWLRVLDPLGLVGVVLIVAWVHLFLCGSGFYFGTVLHGTRPVLANLALVGALWLLLPVFAPLAGDAAGGSQGRGGAGIDLERFTPVGQVSRLVLVSPGRWSLDDGDARFAGLTSLMSPHAQREPLRRLQCFGDVLIAVAAYGSAGALLLWRARRRFRRNAFG